MTSLTPSYQQIIALGDSLTDTGCDLRAAAELSRCHGYQRYSNGPTWIEYLTSLLDEPELNSLAWGGACSNHNNHNSPENNHGLTWQVEHVLTIPPAAKRLYTITCGFNDLYDPSFKYTPREVVDNINNCIEMLYQHQRQIDETLDILVWNLPTSPVPPAYIDPEYQGHAYFSPHLETVRGNFVEFNKLLKDALSTQQNKTDINVFGFDFASSLATMADQFSIIDKQWVTQKPNRQTKEWLWWDHWHLMTEAHQLLAQDALSCLNNRAYGFV